VRNPWATRCVRQRDLTLGKLQQVVSVTRWRHRTPKWRPYGAGAKEASGMPRPVLPAQAVRGHPPKEGARSSAICSYAELLAWVRGWRQGCRVCQKCRGVQNGSFRCVQSVGSCLEMGGSAFSFKTGARRELRGASWGGEMCRWQRLAPSAGTVAVRSQESGVRSQESEGKPAW
jgi:hypothetical protein